MSLSLRAKTIFIAIGGMVALIFVLTLVTVIGLSFMRDRLVSDAVRLAEEQVGFLRDDMVEMIERTGVSSARELLGMPSIERRIRIFDRDVGKIASVIILDNEGKIVIEQKGDSDLTFDVQEKRDERPITRPIMLGDRKVGDLQVTLSRSRILRDIETTSRIMTFQMAGLLAALALILFAVFYLLWRMFRRHVNMVRTQDQMERMAYVGTLASGLAHEIRNPLNAMGLKLQVIEEDIEDPQPESGTRMRTAARTLRAQVEQLNATLGNFLSFALPRGRAKSRFDLREMIREVHDLLEPEFDQRGAEWEARLPDGPVSVVGEPAAFHEVLVNLILNSLQVMEKEPGKRKVAVTLRKEDGVARLTVSDTGPGIAPKDLEKIFEVFFSTREGGSGFGLAIARHIIQDHGGTITARNREVGGAEFIIELPADDEQQSGAKG